MQIAVEPALRLAEQGVENHRQDRCQARWPVTVTALLGRKSQGYVGMNPVDPGITLEHRPGHILRGGAASEEYAVNPAVALHVERPDSTVATRAALGHTLLAYSACLRGLSRAPRLRQSSRPSSWILRVMVLRPMPSLFATPAVML